MKSYLSKVTARLKQLVSRRRRSKSAASPTKLMIRGAAFELAGMLIMRAVILMVMIVAGIQLI